MPLPEYHEITYRADGAKVRALREPRDLARRRPPVRVRRGRPGDGVERGGGFPGPPRCSWGRRCRESSCRRAGGYPADIDLYQATKAVSAVAKALKPGAGLILYAECEEGMGSGNFGNP